MSILGGVIDEEKLVKQARAELVEVLTEYSIHVEGTVSPLSLDISLRRKGE